MAETAFSEDGKYYSAISADGRLKIWDTESNVLKQEYTPDLHLTAPPSCLQWITVSQTGQNQKQGKKRASLNENETQCIALGTSNGSILIYSVAEAKIQSVLGKSGQSKVTALDWSRKCGFFSCDKDSNLVEWELKSARVRNKYNVAVDSKNKGNYVSAIKVIPHQLETPAVYLVTASYQVRLWRLNSGEASLVKTLGHNATQTALLSLVTIKDCCWLIEGSQNERLLSFWDVTITEDDIPLVNGDTPKKKRKKSLTNVPVVTNATYNFVLEDAPRMVDVELKEDEGGVMLSLAAATRSGVVHYYKHMLNGSSIKPIKPSVTIQVSTPAASPLSCHCCRVQDTGDLLLGFLQGALVCFENITPDLKSKTQVLIRGEGKQQKKTKQVNETNKVRSDQHSSDAQIVEPMGGVATRKRVNPGAQLEVPMEARLANLAIDVKGKKQFAVNRNLSKLLVQGLHSKDKSIISMVLHKNNAGVATTTVAGLPAEYIPHLLEQLVNMATLNTSLCGAVCTWLQAVVQRHAALIMALVAAKHGDNITRLLAIFTHRRSHLCQLMNLRGRIEMTLKQREAAEEVQEEQAVLDYNDTSSDEEMQLDKYKSDSDQSWGDDKFSDKDDGMDQDDDDDDDNDDDNNDKDQSSDSSDEE